MDSSATTCSELPKVRVVGGLPHGEVELATTSPGIFHFQVREQVASPSNLSSVHGTISLPAGTIVGVQRAGPRGNIVSKGIAGRGIWGERQVYE